MEMAELEDILQAYVEKETVPEDILEYPKAVNLLNNFNREREERPQILQEIKAFKNYSLLATYLDIPLVDLEQLPMLLKKKPRYLQGDGTTLRFAQLRNRQARKVINAVHWANKFLIILKGYLDMCSQERFGSSYLRRKEIGGADIYKGARRTFAEGMEYIVNLSTCKNVDVFKHWNPIAKFNQSEAVQILLDVYQIYKDQQDIQRLNLSFLSNPEVQKKFGTKAANLFQNANKNLAEKGGFYYILELCGVIDPNILKEWQIRPKFDKSETVSALMIYFRHYLSHNPDRNFNANYMKTDVPLNVKYNRKPRRLVTMVDRRQRKGGENLNSLVAEVAKLDPRIADHWSYHSKKGQNGKT
tara:strand:- start:577 stop:1650 length:1074 start_codon:yes stop_codon:yes gene_type:complete